MAAPKACTLIDGLGRTRLAPGGHDTRSPTGRIDACEVTVPGAGKPWQAGSG